jgi:hypothetical protein
MSSVADTDIDIYDEIVAAHQRMPQEQRDELRRRDVHDRISNILDVCPAASWDLEESQAVLDALSEIFVGRQAAARTK